MNKDSEIFSHCVYAVAHVTDGVNILRLRFIPPCFTFLYMSELLQFFIYKGGNKNF